MSYCMLKHGSRISVVVDMKLHADLSSWCLTCWSVWALSVTDLISAMAASLIMVCSLICRNSV